LNPNAEILAVDESLALEADEEGGEDTSESYGVPLDKGSNKRKRTSADDGLPKPTSTSKEKGKGKPNYWWTFGSSNE
jgi:hypothetical protein